MKDKPYSKKPGKFRPSGKDSDRKKESPYPGKGERSRPGDRKDEERSGGKRSAGENKYERGSSRGRPGDSQRNDPGKKWGERPAAGKGRPGAREDKPYTGRGFKEQRPRRKDDANVSREYISPRSKSPQPEERKPITVGADGKVRLNKFIANSGVCSRREADMLIKAGAVTVNGKIVDELGTKIDPSDVVVYNGQKLSTEKKVYVLLNKPKDYITTSDDPQGRKTVMDLVKLPGMQRLFSVGRLDRNTTGLLILTNDGELTKKLTHPKHGVRKIYHVVLESPVTRADMDKIANGITLEGEVIIPDAIDYIEDGKDKKQIGVELHSGQNRVVRRIFESLDYKVTRLDRVVFAGLTKKDLPRGQWRFLSEKEVNFLQMIK